MAKSILQTEKECFCCHSRYNLSRHHVLYGTANRKHSEEFGLWVWLCFDHHVGNHGVHNGNHALDEHLKILAQTKFEEKYGHEKFMEVFKRNFL